jgi:hypothetical protein
MAQMLTGQVTLKTYQADGITPFDCNDGVMVGESIMLVISSDSNEYWGGGLFISGQDRLLGTLTGRNLDPNTRDWIDSHYEAAGNAAKVTAWKDSEIFGFDFYTYYPKDANSDPNSTSTGDWFVIDYYAEDIGDCNVGFYDYSLSWYEPNYVITLHNVPTRNFNGDDQVDFLDYSMFASHWLATTCNEPNWCNGADLNFDSNVDYGDLGLFVEYWYWGPSSSGVEDANEPACEYQEDANFIYSIVDVNGNNDITIDVNESITLYVGMLTSEDHNIAIFEIEVTISDTSLGSIDNTIYDFNNPPGPGTARILAQPRDPNWDFWGPGWQQEEGVILSGVSFDSVMSDGNLASFVFTCKAPGDVELTLINWFSSDGLGQEVFPKLESIIIHQVDPNSQQMMAMGGEGFDVMGLSAEDELAIQEQAQLLEEQIDVNELLGWLEKIWVEDEELREAFNEEDWQEFIEDIEDLSQY